MAHDLLQRVLTHSYTGRETDITGLMYYRNRYYAPRIGRFTQPDPAGFIDGPNRYLYVGNNPVTFIDPYGLSPSWSWPSLPNGFVDTMAGVGDGLWYGLSFGTLDMQDVRNDLSIDGGIDRSSTEYQSGHMGGQLVGSATVDAVLLSSTGGLGLGIRGSGAVANSVPIEITITKSVSETDDLKMILHLRQVEKELRAQLSNGRAQMAQEIADGHIPNPHGLAKEVNELIPKEIERVLAEISKLTGKK